MRLVPLRFSPWTPLIVGLIAADLFALWVWAARPLHIYSYLLGLPGSREEAPIPHLVAWATGNNGPRTPSGCIALFEWGELVFAAVFLAALLLLILILVQTRRSEGPLRRRLSAPFSLAKAIAVRFRVRTALAAVAILGLYLGWEIHAWRTWRLQAFYSERAAQAGGGQINNQAILELRQKDLARLSQEERLSPADDFAPEIGYYRTRAARAAERAVLKDQWEREAARLSAIIAAYDERKRKYEQAVADPWKAVEPDGPMPEPIRGLSVEHWLAVRDYSRALAGYDELARTYPDYVEAHATSAWIRATCPDARYRDGKLAVASATRACELTNGKDTGALAILAAAWAEAGDFAQAVKWQQKVVAMTQGAELYQEQLELYAAGKAYRQK